MPTYRTPQGLRLDSLVDIGVEFKPTLAMSAKAFLKLELDIRSFRVPLKRSIQQVIAPSIGANFRAGGRPERWVPLSEATMEIKARDRRTRYPVDAPLLRSGLLMRTMQQYNIWTVTPTQAAILDLPEKIWYGKVHQAGYGAATVASASSGSAEGFQKMMQAVLGGGFRAAAIPARPFAMIQVQDVDRIQEVFDVWMGERVAGTILRS